MNDPSSASENFRDIISLLTVAFLILFAPASNHFLEFLIPPCLCRVLGQIDAFLPRLSMGEKAANRNFPINANARGKRGFKLCEDTNPPPFPLWLLDRAECDRIFRVISSASNND